MTPDKKLSDLVNRLTREAHARPTSWQGGDEPWMHDLRTAIETFIQKHKAWTVQK